MNARRTTWARLLAPLLLLSALHLHVDDEPLGSRSIGQRDLYYADPLWHTHAEHVDSGAVAPRPFCPACLHQVQTSGAHQRAVVPFAPPRATSAAIASCTATVPEGGAGPRSARGPPSRS